MNQGNPMTTENNQLVLISGESSTGKSASLRSIPNQSRWIYLNCEAGKRLPFRNSFATEVVTDPYQLYEVFDACRPGGPGDADYDGVIVDTLTFLMEMFESVHVLGAKDTMKAWGEYGQFFKNLMQQRVAIMKKPVIFLGHTRTEVDNNMEKSTAVPVKGALKNQGIEAFFSTVVSTKKMPIGKLEAYKNSMLNITDDDRLVGYKHVFQTRPTKETAHERIRSPMDLWTVSETFIDNDASKLLNHLTAYYGGTVAA